MCTRSVSSARHVRIEHDSQKATPETDHTPEGRPEVLQGARNDSAGRADVVLHLRANRFRDCLELPDRVLRSIASKAANTRLAILANYKVWKAWCEVQKTPAKAVSRGCCRCGGIFAGAGATDSGHERRVDFEVLKTGVTPTGEPAKRYATLARYSGRSRSYT